MLVFSSYSMDITEIIAVKTFFLSFWLANLTAEKFLVLQAYLVFRLLFLSMVNLLCNIYNPIDTTDECLEYLSPYFFHLAKI